MSKTKEQELSVGLTVGGQTIEKVVKKIRFDIDELKSAVAQQAGVEFSDELIDSIVTRVKDALNTSRVYAAEKNFQQSMKDNQTQMSTMRSETDERFRNLEKTLRYEFTDQITKLRAEHDSQLDALRADVARLQECQREHAETLDAHHKRADAADVREAEMYKDILRRHNHLEIELLNIMDAKVNDTFALTDGRMHKLEGDLFEVINRHTEALAVFDTRMNTTANKVTFLEKDYVPQADMLLKADLMSMHSKASAVDLDHSILQSTQTQRQLDSFVLSTTESHQRLEADLTSRTEAKAAWILRTLRKELANKDQGTDIGKIKCLVCDQPQKQKTVVDSVVFGGAPLEATFQPHIQPQGRTRDAFDCGERPGSMSGPESNDRPENKQGISKQLRHFSAGPVSYTRNAPRVRPSSAAADTQYQYNRRLVSLGASPSNNLLTSILAQQQQCLGDVFEDENSQGNYESLQRESAAQVPKRVEYPPPRAVPTNTGSKGGILIPPQGMSKEYFQNLEIKYTGTAKSGGRRPVQFTGLEDGGNPLLKRPTSAPTHKNNRRK